MQMMLNIEQLFQSVITIKYLTYSVLSQVNVPFQVLAKEMFL